MIGGYVDMRRNIRRTSLAEYTQTFPQLVIQKVTENVGTAGKCSTPQVLQCLIEHLLLSLLILHSQKQGLRTTRKSPFVAQLPVELGFDFVSLHGFHI